MKNILIIVLFILQSSILTFSQEYVKCSGIVDYYESQFISYKIQPLVGDTLVAPMKKIVDTNKFILDESRFKKFIIDSLKFVIVKNDKPYDFSYSGNKIIDYDYVNYRSYYKLYVSSIDNVKVSSIVNINSDYATINDKDRKFIISYREDNVGLLVEFEFIK